MLRSAVWLAQVTGFPLFPVGKGKVDSHPLPSLTGGRGPLRDSGQRGKPVMRGGGHLPAAQLSCPPGVLLQQTGGRECLGNPKVRAVLTMAVRPWKSSE